MKKSLKIIIPVALVIIVSVAGIFFINRWNRPLGTALALPTRTPIPQPVLSPMAMIETETEKFTETAVVLPTATEKPLCGGPPLMYILGVGADNEYQGYMYGLADVIRIARVDFVTPKVTVLTIPRDLWVEFPDIIDKYADTVTHGKLNQAYFYGGEGMGYYEGPGGGPGLLARTLAHNYGLYVDYYGAVNMTAFAKIIDALGGIDIYLDQDWDGTPLDETTEDMGYFTMGQHHMSGAEALRFSRIRKKYSDIARADNQTLVICAVKDKVLSPSVISSIPELINSLIGEIYTDLSPAQLGQLTCLLPRLNQDNLQFIRFPDELLKPGRVFDPNLGNTTFVFDVTAEEVSAFLRDFENDAIPANTEGGMSCPD